MTVQTVDLYEYFNIPRGNANGGYLTVYARTESKKIKPRLRPAMLVIPGGGYSFISDREGEPIALRYLDKGFVSFALSYSVKLKYPMPLIEAMLAVMFIRNNAEKYRVNKDKICAIGFSAGGHLCGLLATVKPNEAKWLGRPTADVSLNAAVLSYPVITMGEFTHSGTKDVITGGETALFDKLSIEKRVDGNSAPAFIWHTYEDDCVPVENSLMFATALRKSKIPFTLHIFEHGGHGLALCDNETNDFSTEQLQLYKVGKWFKLSIDWLEMKGITTEVI